jgi:hypothetical protein
MLPESMWTSVVAYIIDDIQSCLAITSRQPRATFNSLIDAMQSRVGKIVGSARALGITAATDMVSVRVRTALGTQDNGSKEVLWPEMEWRDGDKDLGTYSLGLMKIDEQGRSGVLLKSKVATEALMRYVTRCTTKK